MKPLLLTENRRLAEKAVLGLLAAALVLFLLAAVGWPRFPQLSLGWLGLFFCVLAQLTASLTRV